MTQDPVASPSRGLSPSLFLFALVYGGMVVLAGVLGNKQVALGPLSAIGPSFGLGPLAVEAGIFPFLLLVALSSALSELHGQAVGTRIVLWGFVPLVLSMALIGLVYVIPAAQDMDPARLAAFDIIMGSSPRFMAAGIVAYGTSQMLNVAIFNRLRGADPAQARTGWLAARGAIASALSQVVDTLLFITIAFYGVFPIGELMAGQMLSKVALSLTLIPLVITALVVWGRRLDAAAAA